MSAQHSKGKLGYGPWREDGCICGYSLTINGHLLPLCEMTAGPEDDFEANARRLVACWNAFDGLETEMVESMVNVPEFFFKHTDLMTQRDALLAELQNIAAADPRKWDAETRDQFQQWAQNRARAAIAKVTGRPT